MKDSPEDASADLLKISTKPEEMTSQALLDSLKKNKKEILGLKIMLYTGILLLLGGFFYYNNAVQNVRLQTMDSNLFFRQSQGDLNMIMMQKGIMQDIKALKRDVDDLNRQHTLGNGNHVEQSVVGMNDTLTLLRNEPQKVRELALQVQRTSRAFLEAYKTRNGSTSNR